MTKKNRNRANKLLRFMAGALVIFLAALFFGSGYTPPGICGEVIRHNQKMKIDASPFFYGDVENMLDIIESAEQMHRLACLEKERDNR